MDEAEQRLSNDLIGVAGVHFVAFKLSLQGLIVLPTIRTLLASTSRSTILGMALKPRCR